MDKLSKEELIAILAKTQEKPRKERKKPVLDEEKKTAMLERLAVMRETVKENREKKKSAVAESFYSQKKEADIDQVFEKKYGSKFDKMTDILIDLNENTKEQLKLKREKVAKKTVAPIKLEVKEKEGDDWDDEVKQIKNPELVRPIAETPTVAKPIPIPKPAPPPPNAHPQSSPAPNTQQYLLPNRSIFKKCNTRF